MTAMTGDPRLVEVRIVSMMSDIASLCEPAPASSAIEGCACVGSDTLPVNHVRADALEASSAIDLSAIAAAMLGFNKRRKTDRLGPSKF